MKLLAALGNDAALNTTLTNSIALKAPLASPTFTGVPISTTPATSDDSTKIATTAYVVAKVGAAGGATTLNGLTDVNTSGVSTGQVLSYTGSAWGVADAGSGGSGGSIDLVADGAIAAGKAVVIDTAGTVSQVATAASNFVAHGYKYSVGRGHSTIHGNTTSYTSDPHNYMHYDDSIDRVIYMPNGSTNGSIGAGEINETTGAVTWTNILTLPSSLSGNPFVTRGQAFYNSTLNRSVILGYDKTADKIEGMQYTLGTSSSTQNVSAVLLTGSDAS